MLNVVTRTAPRNARLIRPSPGHLAAIDDMVARASAFNGGGRMAALSTEAGQADPAPAVPPNTPTDTSTRLDGIDAQLADHEGRIARLEQNLPEPGLNDGEGAKPAEAHATNSRPTMIDSRALYARARSLGATPTASTPAAPEQIQRGAGQMLDGRAINARFNAFAAAHAGRAM